MKKLIWEIYIYNLIVEKRLWVQFIKIIYKIYLLLFYLVILLLSFQFIVDSVIINFQTRIARDTFKKRIKTRIARIYGIFLQMQVDSSYERSCDS